jgi:CRISPR-associated protein Csb3
MTIRINVDATNPGQFFACCGLLELADRLWKSAEGWFEDKEFCISAKGNLPELITAISTAKLNQIDPNDNTSSPIEIGAPFRPLRLDWWQDERAGGKVLKVWAGTMESTRIARGMQHAMRDVKFRSAGLLDHGLIAYDPDNLKKKVEPYYFDARRAPNAHSRDVGFSPNDLQITTTAFPAVELLCLVGLQRCLPSRTDQPRVFDYCTWAQPIPPSLLAPVACGKVTLSGHRRFRFENCYRTGQRKHKSFRSAIRITGD